VDQRHVGILLLDPEIGSGLYIYNHIYIYILNHVKPIDFIDSYIIINKRRFLGVSHFYPFSSGRKSVTSSVFDPPSNVALYTLPICCTLDSNSSCCCSFANVISSVHSPYPRASPVRPRPSSITTEPKYYKVLPLKKSGFLVYPL
jgi:hypothetical protein